jgi:DNA invertase Pin-like site-specific DNA recombinase
MKRVIIYARVSTKEQNVDIQLNDIHNYSESRKLTAVQEYIDYASGFRNAGPERLATPKILIRYKNIAV